MTRPRLVPNNVRSIGTTHLAPSVIANDLEELRGYIADLREWADAEHAAAVAKAPELRDAFVRASDALSDLQGAVERAITDRTGGIA